jgi:hypothetical protein
MPFADVIFRHFRHTLSFFLSIRFCRFAPSIFFHAAFHLPPLSFIDYFQLVFRRRCQSAAATLMFAAAATPD